MAKKGSRVQVILECTEHKTSGQQVQAAISAPRTRKTLLNVWS